MADGHFNHHTSMMDTVRDGKVYLLVDPWLIVGLAAHYHQEFMMFEEAGQVALSMQSDYMLNGLQTLAGIILHNDGNYFTFGEGFEEFMVNTGKE